MKNNRKKVFPDHINEKVGNEKHKKHKKKSSGSDSSDFSEFELNRKEVKNFGNDDFSPFTKPKGWA